MSSEGAEVNKAEISWSEGPLDGSDGSEAVSQVVGVAPSVLVAVVFGVLATVVLLFSLALLMDRWNRRFSALRAASRGRSGMTDAALADYAGFRAAAAAAGTDGTQRTNERSAIVEEMCPDATEDLPPALVAAAAVVAAEVAKQNATAITTTLPMQGASEC